jgi:hypothetical protein
MSVVDAGGWCGVGAACMRLVPAPWGAPTQLCGAQAGLGKGLSTDHNQCMPALEERAIALACAVLATASQHK